MNAFPDPYHYRLVARAIAWLETHHRRRPGLADLAAALGLSPVHFQRVFSQWAGVSPTPCLDHLTLAHARAMLRARLMPQEEIAAATDLGGAQRLPAPVIRWEACGPGPRASRGVGLVLDWGAFPSPFGPVVALGTEHGIAALGFAERDGIAATRDALAARWPAARLRAAPEGLAPRVADAFAGRPGTLHVFGAPFQIRVWKALLAIPPGRLASYQAIAGGLGTPGGARAVGAAVGQNPIAALIPCHRVIGGTGALTGYRWGLPIKAAMLARESAQAATAAPNSA